MDVVTVSSSASRTPLSLGTRFSTCSSRLRRFDILAFKTDQSKNSDFVTPKESINLPMDPVKVSQKVSTRASKNSKRLKAVSTHEASSCTVDLDYNEVAASLENIYKLSPADVSDVDECDRTVQRHHRTWKRIRKGDEKADTKVPIVVRNRKRKAKRLKLDTRIALKKSKEELVDRNKKENSRNTKEDVERLVRDYSMSTDLVSLDWRKMKIPAVLSSSEHNWLFKLMQPMKTIMKVKENLHIELEKEPTDGMLASAVNMSMPEMRRHLEIGRAARNKLIKHNLRLVLFVINKYFQEIASGPKFQDLCQAGVKGLITAIDRFEPKRGFRLSTYGLFWIRHAIVRSMTVSSFARVPFGIESVRQEIQRAKLELTFELKRLPTEEEIIERVGISTDRYHDVLKASKPVLSLHSKHTTTQEEFIKGITDTHGAGGDKHRQPALLRLALDDVLDSLKPKESLVIRQRYGLDGKGDRTLGEIAGNLNISREMVRKHETKALMKLKHPARVDYLRGYLV